MSHGDVIVQDVAIANRLYNKGYFGTPETGNTLRLSPIEAAYLIQEGRLEWEATIDQLIAGRETEFIGYSEMRRRALVVRMDGQQYGVWPRGEGPPNPPAYHIRIQSERLGVEHEMLWQMAQHENVLCMVDDDGVTTHYQVQTADPRGTNPPAQGRYDGRVLGDRVIVDGLPEGFGSQQGCKWLSLHEACYLQSQGLLRLDEDIMVAGKALQSEFATIASVYADLRQRGTLPRSGYRFGTHLRAYSGSMDEHAPWLIDCALGSQWSNISRGVRLAHGVRKEFLLALPDPVRYVTLSWIRP